jgi:hypothetical protein
MSPISLVSENDAERTYRLDDGRIVKIKVDELSGEIFVTDQAGNRIGRVELEELEIEEGKPLSAPVYRLKWMYNDLKDQSYVHKGIGREALKFFKELTGATITASENDGMRKDDGSHLTGDAPAFVAQMRREKIIE